MDIQKILIAGIVVGGGYFLFKKAYPGPTGSVGRDRRDMNTIGEDDSVIPGEGVGENGTSTEY